MKIVRRLGNKLVLLQFHWATGGGSNFYTARAYIQEDAPIFVEHQKQKVQCTSLSRCQIENDFYLDLGQLDLTGNIMEKSHTDVYRLIDTLFPELVSRGLKAEGYVKFTVDDIEQSTLKFESHH